MGKMIELNISESGAEEKSGSVIPSYLMDSDPVEEKAPDRLLGIRVVLLIATGLSMFIAPIFITLILGTAWLVAMV